MCNKDISFWKFEAFCCMWPAFVVCGINLSFSKNGETAEEGALACEGNFI